MMRLSHGLALLLLVSITLVYAKPSVPHSLLAADAVSSSDPSGENPKTLDGVVKKSQQDTERTLARAKETDPEEMLKEDYKLVLRNFMPGRRPDATLLYGLPAAAFISSVVWLIGYWCYLYTNDRDEKLDRWSHVARNPRQEDERMKNVKPDFILLFHHPNFEYSDKGSALSVAAARKCMVKMHQSGYLKRTEDYLASQTPIHSATSHILGAFQRGVNALKTSPRADEEVKEVEEAPPDEEAMEEMEKETVTMGHIREALLQDLYDALPGSGFEIISFSSVDDDEIFVGVSLENQDVIREELIRGKVKLQIQTSAVEKLQIGQDPNEMESSPPFLQYDPRLAPNVLGHNAVDRNFYKTFHGKDSEGSIVSGVDRIRLIQRHLQSHINLDVCVQQGILKDWYPVHSTYWLQELDACWANLSLLKDLSFVQPMTFIQQYFGSRVAFTCAWNGLYCKMLLALIPVAIIFEAVDFAGHHAGTSVKGVVLTFSIVLAIWAKVAWNLWEREQEYFMALWDLNTAPDFSVRPDFFGTYEVDPVDSKQTSLQYPHNWYVARQAASWCVTVFFCVVVGVCVFCWISIFHGRMDIVASICLAIMIQIFQFIYNAVAEITTKKENHKYQVDFYSSYLMKLFIFQFVNQFSAYFFIAVKQQHTKWGCPNDDCISLLRQQLSMTLAICSVLQVVMACVNTLKVKVFLWLEDRALQQECEKAGKEIPLRGFIEEQAKYEEYRIRAQIESMVQLVVALGYVLIFGAVAPRIVPLCFLVFIVQLKATAYMTTACCRRPLPRKSTGLGAWMGIVRFLMVFGVIFSGFLLVTYGPSFHGTFLMTKVSGFILYVTCALLLWELVSLFIPPTGKQAKILQARREHVLQRVAKANEEANIAQLKAEHKQQKGERGRGGAQLSAEILSGAYDKIPHLVDAEYGTNPTPRPQAV